jgi:hypothetical protein
VHYDSWAAEGTSEAGEADKAEQLFRVIVKAREAHNGAARLAGVLRLLNSSCLHQTKMGLAKSNGTCHNSVQEQADQRRGQDQQQMQISSMKRVISKRQKQELMRGRVTAILQALAALIHPLIVVAQRHAE